MRLSRVSRLSTSTDGSLDVLKRLTRDYPELRIVALAQHAGQTAALAAGFRAARGRAIVTLDADRSEEHTSELQSLAYLVCRLLLEKKKKNYRQLQSTTP